MCETAASFVVQSYIIPLELTPCLNSQQCRRMLQVYSDQLKWDCFLLCQLKAYPKMRWLMKFFLSRISPDGDWHHLWLKQQTHNVLNFDHFTLGSGCGILLQPTLLCACGWLHGGCTYNKDTTYVYSQQSDTVSIMVHVLYVCTCVHICHTVRGCIVIRTVCLKYQLQPCFEAGIRELPFLMPEPAEKPSLHCLSLQVQYVYVIYCHAPLPCPLLPA